jgi:hypothetical protein
MAFDGEVEAIANINGIRHRQRNPRRPHDLTQMHRRPSHELGRHEAGPGQEQAIRVVKAVQKRHQRGWRTQIEWVPGPHRGFAAKERADQLAGEAASDKQKGRASIAWLKERISQHYAIATEMETEKGKIQSDHRLRRNLFLTMYQTN